jgi:hypothetical protein
MARIFISYKRHNDPDVRLAGLLRNRFTQKGHEVFIDTEIRIGTEWPKTIDAELEKADFLVALLSPEAVTSEMIAAEIAKARALKKTKGKPVILPVRVANEAAFPYDLAGYLNRVQTAFWRNGTDDLPLARTLLAAIANPVATVRPHNARMRPEALGPDGGASVDAAAPAAPLPGFDPRWLDALDNSGGAVRLTSPFYVERDIDALACRAILKDGVTVRVEGARQTGKSSLLARLFQHARDEKLQAVYIDFQILDKRQFSDLDTLLLHLARLIAAKMKPNRQPSAYWDSGLGAKDKLTEFIAGEILDHLEKPLVLLFDEVDRVFEFAEYRSDFFGLIRSWHNARARDPLWQRLNLVLAYSTEARELIRDGNQSPFNVGEVFTTSDFAAAQVRRLNEKHGSPVKEKQVNTLIKLLAGHPFLIRKSLYEMAAARKDFQTLLRSAYDDDGPFGDHLRYYMWWLGNRPGAQMALKEAITTGIVPSDSLFHSLRSAGLITGHSRSQVKPRCGLYAKYLGDRL